ncbi:hypothetical protein AAZX31_01G153000 [Glycine max]|nr:hypothetical protein JHK87_001999 [Glycine soja]KAG5069683.1 hypothetical protein JHK85_002060 [Glycine max]
MQVLRYGSDRDVLGGDRDRGVELSKMTAAARDKSNRTCCRRFLACGGSAKEIAVATNGDRGLRWFCLMRLRQLSFLLATMVIKLRFFYQKFRVTVVHDIIPVQIEKQLLEQNKKAVLLVGTKFALLVSRI